MKNFFQIAMLFVMANVSSVSFADNIPLSDILDAETKITLKKMNDELLAPPPSGAGVPGAVMPGGMTPSMSPLGMPARLPAPDVAASTTPKRSSPVMQLMYGTSSASENTYRAALAWGEQTYPVEVGTVVKGYVVSSISSRGIALTKVSKGKQKGETLFAPSIVDSGQAESTKLVSTPQPN